MFDNVDHTVVRRWFRISGKRVGINVVYWLSGVGSAQAANMCVGLNVVHWW